jgi:hypothetical protein
VFQQLLRNLERLSRWPDAANRAELRIRTAVSPESPVWQPELRSLVQRLQAAGVRVRVPNKEYSNWGGLVSATDVAGLDLRLRPASAPRDLPCALLFYKHTVLPDGKLNACYGGDGNATLVIGDLTRSTFDDIYSSRNERYVQLVRGHFEGRFGPTCQACTGYRSLRDQHYSYAFHETPFLSLAEFLEQLDRHGGIPGGGECGAPGSSSS